MTTEATQSAHLRDADRTGTAAAPPRSPTRLLVIAAVLILGGSLLAWAVQTSLGSIDIRDVRWESADGRTMSALLYVPPNATPETPAPGIVAIHGYINSRETQSGFAIEFARRGYVVLAADQSGHGYSDPPAFAGGFGGPAALQYLRSLDFVDTENIGVEGHSMGGWASLMAAAAYPDDYRALVIEGSSTGSSGTNEGTPEWPRNTAVVFSRWDEFSGSMWNSPVADEIEQTEKLQTLFGTSQPVVEGRLYGSIADGTARQLFQPATNHPGDHLSRVAIGHAVEWFQNTLDGGSDLDPASQTWYWKELGTLIGAIGMIVLLIGAGSWLLSLDLFADLRRTRVPALGATGSGWWIAAAVTAVLGPLTFFRFKDFPGEIGWSASSLFPQGVTNAVIAWTTPLALISLALFGFWHYRANRSRAGAGDAYGLTWAGRTDAVLIGKSLLLSLATVAAGYVALLLMAAIFTVDFRFWVFAIKPMSGLQLRMALVYFVPFAFFFLILNLGVFGQLRRDDWSARRSLFATIGVLTIGWIALYLIQYVPLLTTGQMTFADEALWTIISYQLLPIMAIVGVILSVFNRWTGRIYVGAFTSALLVSWIVVASQATHFAFN